MPFQQQFIVTMADGKTHTVTVDDRDLAALEAQEVPDEHRITRARFLCWNALIRTDVYSEPFDQFNARDCVTVDVPDDDAEEEQPAPKAAARKSTRGRSVRSGGS